VRFFNDSKQNKSEEYMGLQELERVWSYFFKKINANYNASSSCVFRIAPCLDLDLV
jgi:hypothetical protein